MASLINSATHSPSSPSPYSTEQILNLSLPKGTREEIKPFPTIPSWFMHPSTQFNIFPPPTPLLTKQPLPLDIILEVAEILDARQQKLNYLGVGKGIRFHGTLASLSVLSKGVRTAVLETLWKYQGEVPVVVCSVDTKLLVRSHLEIVSCPNALSHIGFTNRLQDLPKIVIWTLKYTTPPSSNPSPNPDLPPCTECTYASTFPHPLTFPQISMPNLTNLHLQGSMIKQYHWSRNPFQMRGIEKLIVEYDSVERSGGLGEVLEGVGLIFPEIRTLIVVVFVGEYEDEIELLQHQPCPWLGMEKLEQLTINPVLSVSPAERILKDKNKIMTISGSRNYLIDCPNAILGDPGASGLGRSYQEGNDKVKDKVRNYLLGLFHQLEGYSPRFPLLKQFTYIVCFTWTVQPIKRNILYVVHAEKGYKDDPNAWKLSRPFWNGPEPIHPDGRVGCQVSGKDGNCVWADYLAGVKDVGRFFCQACSIRRK